MPAWRASDCRPCDSTPTRSTVVTRLIELHLRFFGYAEGAWTDSAVRRYVRDAGPELDRLHILTRADVTTRNKRKSGSARRVPTTTSSGGSTSSPRRRSSTRCGPSSTATASRRCSASVPGREVGEAYRFLLDLRLDEGVLGEAEAEARLREWWAAQS